MRSGTHRDLYSGANNAVLHAQSDRCGLGHIETYNSAPKDAVLQSKSTDEGIQNDRSCLVPTETCNSRPKVSVLHAQNHR